VSWGGIKYESGYHIECEFVLKYAGTYAVLINIIFCLIPQNQMTWYKNLSEFPFPKIQNEIYNEQSSEAISYKGGSTFF
jgi:hypothetical protein